MITSAWLPLYLGFAATAALVAYSDIRFHRVHDILWLPAIINAVFFYSTTAELIIRTTILSALILSMLTLLTMVFAFKRSIGGADVIAVAVFSVWPLLFMYSILPGIGLSAIRRIRARRFTASNFSAFWARVEGRLDIHMAGFISAAALFGLLLLAIV